MKKPKRIVITGVSRGLGRALAEGFAKTGHVVLGCARSQRALAELAARFRPPSTFEVVDVARDDEVHGWAERILQSGGPPDLLVNNAAVINPNAPLWDVPTEEFSRLVDVNIKGVFHVIRALAPAMIARGRGVIVNISSGWGRSTAAEVAPYCASKWAIEGLTQALAQDLPEGLAAVPVNPGIIHTDMLRSCFGVQAASFPSPESWAARAVPFLLGLGPADNGRPLSVPD